jgi:S-adenosylmethionine:tRNA ribosyltransferase-isomerase
VIAAHDPVQRPADARLLAVDRAGHVTHGPRRRFLELLRAGDLVVANDAATLPASLHGRHERSGAAIEVRLAQRASLDAVDRFTAVVFGGGNWRTRTEDRPAPPPMAEGDTLRLGPLRATLERVMHAGRLVVLRFEGTPAAIWDGLARHGRPIQYSHLREPLAIWDTWTPIASIPVAFEPPSAGFVLDWASLDALRERGVAFATLTHAAGISSTGDEAIDRLLPFDEPYRIPGGTAAAIAAARRRGGRVVAVGTTVVRALEDAARGRRVGERPHRRRHAVARGRRDPLGHARGGLEPPRSAARLRRCVHAGIGRPRARGARLPHARIRRLDPVRARGLKWCSRRAATA